MNKNTTSRPTGAIRPFALRLLCGSAFALLIVLQTSCSQSASEEQLLEQARESIEARDFSAASIHLKNALNGNAKSAEARWLLGRVYVALSNGNAAVKELERSLEFGWPKEQAAVPLARAYLLRDPSRVSKDLFRFIDDEQNFAAETRAELQLVRALAMWQTGEPSRATTMVELATEAAPNAAASHFGRALVALNARDWESAKSWVEKTLSLDPDRAEVIATRGDIALAQNRREDAISDYRKAAKLAPGKISYRLAFIELLVRKGELDAADEELKPILNAIPDAAAPRYLSALIAYQRKDYRAVMRQADKVLQTSRTHQPSLFVAGAAAYALGLYERANEYLVKIDENYSKNNYLSRLQTANQLQLGNVDAALSSMPAQTTDWAPEDALFLETVGTQIAGYGHLDQAEKLLSAAAKADPSRVSPLTRLALTKIQNNDWSGGAAVLQRARELNPDSFEAEAFLVLTALKENRLKDAETAAHRLRDKFPAESWSAVLLGLVNVRLGETEAAKAAFRQALEHAPGDADAANNLGLVLEINGEFEEAIDAFETALEKRPGNLNLLVKLAALEARLRRADRAVLRLEEAIAANPKAELPSSILARAYLLSERATDALRVGENFAKQGGDISADLVEVLANASLQLADYSAAVTYFEKLAEVSPESAQIQRSLAASSFRSANYAKAIAAAEHAIALDSGDDAATKLILARSLAATKRLPEAKSVVQALLKSNPDGVALLDFSGSLAVAERRFGDAAVDYRRAYSIAPTGELARKLATILLNLREDSEAEKILQERLQKSPTDAATRLLIANHYMNVGSLAKAQQEFATLVEQQPEQPVVRNQLAWLLLEAGNAEAALPHAQRAYRLDAQNPQYLDTLGTVYLQLGDNKKALPLLQQASSALPQDKNVATNLAYALAANGLVVDAKALLVEVLKGDEAFQARQSALDLRKKLGRN